MTLRTHLLASVALCCAAPIFAQSPETLAPETPGQSLPDAALFELSPITVHQSLRGVQTQTAASTTVITSDEIEARQATTMAGLLDTIPNVALVNGDMPQGAGVSIRGLGTQSGTYGTDGKVAVVVDGVASSAEEVYRNGAMLALEPELFRTLRVQRGPSGGFRYASGSIGGTIEAETKDAADFLTGGDTFAFRQKLGYESNGDGLLSTSILAWKPDDKLDVLAFYGYREMGDREDGDGTRQEATAFEQPSGMVKLGYQLSPEHRLSFSTSYSAVPDEDVPYNAYQPGWTDVLVDRDIEDVTSYFAWNWDPQGNDLIDMEARLTFKREKMRITSASTASDIYNTDHDTRRVGLDVSNTARFGTGIWDHVLTGGMELSRRDKSSTELAGSYAGYNARSAPGGTDDTFALYLSDEMRTGALTLTPQLRYEHQTLTSEGNDYAYGGRGGLTAGVPDGTEITSEAVTGALSAHYALTERSAIFGTMAYNENLPILDDLRSDSLRDQSEKGRTFELGASFDFRDLWAADDRLQVKMTGYQTAIWSGTTYSGVDTVDMHGVELEASYSNALFYADFNAAMARGEINDSGDDFKWLPADQVQLTLGRRFLDDQLDLSLEARHAWAQTRTPDTNAAYYPGTVASEDYTILSVSAAYTPQDGFAAGTEFRATIENLTDETYRPYLSTRNASGRNLKLSIARVF